ncbi:hypothetical protein DFH11DRAFT_1044762 [Phellopilus nigrolimitatus]|nr:hypothetical protein DFH11DRAFT_1044762 [Phellopilus nigrolimitatus]
MSCYSATCTSQLVLLFCIRLASRETRTKLTMLFAFIHFNGNTVKIRKASNIYSALVHKQNRVCKKHICIQQIHPEERTSNGPVNKLVTHRRSDDGRFDLGYILTSSDHWLESRSGRLRKSRIERVKYSRKECQRETSCYRR